MLVAVSLTILGGLTGVSSFYLHYGWALFSFLLLTWVLGPGSRHFTEQRFWVSPLVFVGMISYSLYLFHFPLFKLAGAAWFVLFAAKPDSFLIPTLASLLMIPLAWVFYRLVELPTHRFAQKLGTAIQVRG